MSKKDKARNEEPLEPDIIEENSVQENGPEAEIAEENGNTEPDLAQQLIEALTESAKNLDGWQRAQAEFVNYRKRVESQNARMYEDAAARVVKQFLPVLDDLTRALQDKPGEGQPAEWAGGIELISRKLLTILDNEGVKTMEVEGELFDPNLHEAIAQTESPDHESGQIIEVIQPGYMIGERVLRAALVRVAS